MQRFRLTKRCVQAGATLLAVLSLAVCAPAPAIVVGPAAGPGYQQADVVPEFGRQTLTDHVILVSIDGLRPDAIERFGAGTLQRLMREGRYSLEAQTILPSRTLPSHASIFTGVGPDEHGISRNDPATAEDGTITSPTIFARARAVGLVTAAFFSKGKFKHMLEPEALDHGAAPAGDGRWYAGTTSGRVRRYLAEERPNLLFVHLGEPDYAGHIFGWMSSVYGWAVRRADGALGEILLAADQAFGTAGYTVIVTSDHGGHGRTHGSDDPRDVTIPWIIWGNGVDESGLIEEPIHTTETAATVLWLLGIPAELQGPPVRSAFAVPALPDPLAGS